MSTIDSSSPTSKTTTVAVLGCGKYVKGNKEGWAIGHAHAQGWIAGVPGVRLLGVDPSEENLKAFGERFNLPPENLFPSTDALYAALTPDYVSICTWSRLHAHQAIEAASKGVKGIACEKPMAMDGYEMQTMIDACKKSGTRMVISHQRRHLPAFERARAIIADGKLGEVLSLEARVHDGWDILSWTTHWFDMASFLFNAKPESVIAGVDFTGERRYNHAVENSSVVFVEFSGGHQATFITGPASMDGISHHVRGSKGYLSVIDNTVDLYTKEGFSTFTEQSCPTGGFGPMLASLVEAVEKGTMPTCDVSNASLGTAIAYAAHESARTQKKVTLPMTARFAPLEILAHPSKPTQPSLNGRVILFADDHYGSRGRHGLATALCEITGQEVVDLEAANGLKPSDVEGAGLIVIYHTQKEASQETKDVLNAWVAQGKPLLMAHCAVGAYGEWSEFQQWCGRVWEWGVSKHPYEPSVLVADPSAGFPWQESWLPKDEVFTLLGDRSEVTDFCTVTISDGTYPAAWVSKKWPNIAAWIPGHREDLYQLESMRDGLRATISKALLSSVGK